MPYYWSIAPDYDATITPRITTKQGVLLQGEFRQRTIDGSWQIRGYGIDQLDKGAFARRAWLPPFPRRRRTKGQFALNERWLWGWDGRPGDRQDVLPGLSVGALQHPLTSFAT